MDIVYRAAFIFFFLWFITRVTGRTTLGELNTFQLLLYVTMGDLVQQAVTEQDYSVTSSVLAVGVFALLTIGLSWINTHWKAGRPVTNGTPMVVAHNGEPLLDVMRNERMSLDDLMSAAREQGIERIGDIRVAVLETNGKVAFFTGDSGDGAPDQQPAVG